MKTKDWIVVVAALFLTVLVDQITKIWILNKPEMWFGPIHFILAYNEGAMLGLFSNLPAFLRIVTLSTSGFFILSIYCFLQFIIPIPVLPLRIGLSLLVGGIIGNVLDRTYYGHVVDFIGFQVGQFHSPIWNIADMIQWVGYFLIIISLFKNGHELWPDNNFRRVFWVNKKFQLKYAAVFIMSGLFITLISLVFSYTYIKVTLEQLAGTNPTLVKQYTQAFLYSFVILCLTFSVVLFTIAKFISHRIAGPIYAFERFLSEVLEGKGLTKSGQALKLRAGDDFRHLEELAEKVREKILYWNSDRKIEVVEFNEAHENQNEDDSDDSGFSGNSTKP